MTKLNWERVRRESRYEAPSMSPGTGTFTARYPGWCPICRKEVARGALMAYSLVKGKSRAVHKGCVLG